MCKNYYLIFICYSHTNILGVMSQQWDSLHYKAKTLEARLEKKVQNYSTIAQKINANFSYDEENPLIGNNEEQTVSSEIERDLGELYDCIQAMRQFNSSSLSNQQEILIKRYYEIHFDYSNEFKNTSATVQRKRESMELMHSSKSSHKDDQTDSSMMKLLRENNALAASMKSVSDIISNAFEVKNTLQGQRNTLGGSNNALNTINVPGFGRLIDGIQKKKGRETTIIGVVVALLICLTIWWVFLR